MTVRSLKIALFSESRWSPDSLWCSPVLAFLARAHRNDPLCLFNRHSWRDIAESEDRPIITLNPSADADFFFSAVAGDSANDVNPPTARKPALQSGSGSRPRFRGA